MNKTEERNDHDHQEESTMTYCAAITMPEPIRRHVAAGFVRLSPRSRSSRRGSPRALACDASAAFARWLSAAFYFRCVFGNGNRAEFRKRNERAMAAAAVAGNVIRLHPSYRQKGSGFGIHQQQQVDGKQGEQATPCWNHSAKYARG